MAHPLFGSLVTASSLPFRKGDRRAQTRLWRLDRASVSDKVFASWDRHQWPANRCRIEDLNREYDTLHKHNNRPAANATKRVEKTKGNLLPICMSMHALRKAFEVGASSQWKPE